MLGKKLEFIERNMPTEIIKKKDLDNLIKLTKATVQIRDVCVHGMINSYDEQKIEISKINGRKSEHSIEIFTIDRNRLDRSANNLSVLQQEWNSISLTLIEYAGGIT